ncbi:Putative uncharacterized protein [Propionibacterium freudenreichii]|uniref:DUF2065 domain-containing protein n=1 Tax=Propionibacterium freudenreichii TaxID=1744 RepID=UPI0005A5C2AF|nr:DUF2065 domain-containing protein [Propionibacterium freudenreichii]MDK9675713.1 DUF2065 domain-containing protein [Propionibacterium freudenreichii]WFF31705.1 DUF2065 domain-containing protein [Propionibacterium freudenreichii]CEI27118.1 Putative uncharacterized protein [Propionibacterium freudenreichii]CEI47254.1 Putative uncharacterized protein [Propionibacterium freudenreichii]
MTNAVLKRVVRRETHSPRTVATVILLVLVALAAIYVGIEIVLRLLGIGPLLVAPGAALTWLQDLPDQPPSLIIAGGLIALVAGLVLVWLALGPGRRPKHQLGSSSYAVIVDNGVIASSVAERVRRELDLAKGAVVVGVGHRSADITVRPEPGQAVDRRHVRAVAESELAGYELSPRVKVRARVLRAADVEGLS